MHHMAEMAHFCTRQWYRVSNRTQCSGRADFLVQIFGSSHKRPARPILEIRSFVFCVVRVRREDCICSREFASLISLAACDYKTERTTKCMRIHLAMSRSTTSTNVKHRLKTFPKSTLSSSSSLSLSRLVLVLVFPLLFAVAHNKLLLHPMNPASAHLPLGTPTTIPMVIHATTHMCCICTHCTTHV